MGALQMSSPLGEQLLRTWLTELCVDVLPLFSSRLHQGNDLIIRDPD